MDKAMDMGKSSATGSFQLLIGVVASSVIMALGTLILGWLLSREDLGLYGVAILPASIINFFRDWGVNSAMTKEIARLRAINKEGDIHRVIVSGIFLEVVSGAILSIVCYATAEPLAIYLKLPAASTLISILSITIFFSAILAGANAIFIGFEKMKLNSLITIFSAIVKTAAGPLLVILSFGAFGAIVGFTISAIAGGILSIILVYFLLYRPLQKSKVSWNEIFSSVKSMLKYGLPLTVSNIVVGVIPLVFALIMTPFAGVALMGDYNAAVYFIVLLTFFSIPISTVLFPTFAKLNPQSEPELVKTVFSSSVKYTSLLLVPATMAIMTLSSPMINTLFPDKFPFAPLFLTLAVIINLYAAVGNLSLGTFLTGIGATNQLAAQSIVSFIVGLPFALIVIPFFGAIDPTLAVVSSLLGILISTAPGMIWGLYWIWKHYKAKTNYRASAKIFAASSIATIATYLCINSFSAYPWIKLAVGFVLFLVIYLSSAPLLGAINRTDVNNLRAMFSGLGFVSKILELPLKYMEKLSKTHHNNKKESATKN